MGIDFGEVIALVKVNFRDLLLSVEPCFHKTSCNLKKSFGSRAGKTGMFSDRKRADDLRIVRTLVIGYKWESFSSMDFQHQQFVNIFFILPDLLLKFLNLGCNHWLPEIQQFL